MLVLLSSLSYGGMPPARSKRTVHEKDFPGMESDAPPIYPERRLWTAVILSAVLEYEQQLQHIQKLWTATHRPLAKGLLNHLRSLRYEIRHDWFRHVCDLADIDQSHVVRRIRELDQRHLLHEVKFTDEDTLPTRYQMRKARKRVRYA